MKRIICAVLAISMIFALAACSGKGSEETTTFPTPVIEEKSHSKAFTDESGKTVFTVDVIIPQVTEKCDEKTKAFINRKAFELFENACNFAQNNLENAGEFMRQNNSDAPWSKKITFETTLHNNRFLCFMVKDSLSYFGGEGGSVFSTLCFDIQKGRICTLADFATSPDDAEGCFDMFLNDVVAPVLHDRFHNPDYITEDVLERLDEIADMECFYLTEKGLGIYFDKSDVHEFLSGTYKISFSWDEIGALMQHNLE